jgi:hypothetical protein
MTASSAGLLFLPRALRHYEGHKTLIKRMLVGDPALGFVEKHYRL